MIMKQTLLFLLVFIKANCLSAQTPIYNSSSAHHPIVAQEGMVATQHHLATEVGLDVLKQGGNAVDAAVAVGFALAVVLPRAGNLGGGGFMLVHETNSRVTRAINYREMAPKAAHRDMYLDSAGEVDEAQFNLSYNSVGVPGTVAGMIHALKNYGTMSLQKVIAPAIELAEDGFMVTYDLSEVLEKRQERLRQSIETEKIFYKGEHIYQPGQVLKQPDLAWSLRQISERGLAGFYQGELASRLVESIQGNGGMMTIEDLKNYKVTETAAVAGTYRGFEIASMPPPSSGGVHVIQMLNILEGYDLKSSEHNSAATIHLMVEAMRYAYADRSEHLGDPVFWDVPTKGLISQAYANDIRTKIKSDSAGVSTEVKPGKPSDYVSEETTHFSIVDKYGNAVSNTYTLNFSFGSGLVAKGTGILLNNEMGDFSAKPGSANAYGLVGGEANAVEPRKRPLSSMTPTIVLKEGQPYIVTGSPGGSRIITTVLQLILNVIDHDMNIAEATHASRIHHQWLPDVLYYEKYLNPDTRKLLEAMGHTLQERNAMGSTQSIMIEDGLMFGSSDPRRPDARTSGY